MGYGDVAPDTWISRLSVIILIIFGICLLPKKLESLGQAVAEREKAEFNNTNGFAQGTKHIVVTIPFLDSTFVHDFLTEFYAHKKHQVSLFIREVLILLFRDLWSFCYRRAIWTLE